MIKGLPEDGDVDAFTNELNVILDQCYKVDFEVCDFNLHNNYHIYMVYKSAMMSIFFRTAI